VFDYIPFPISINTTGMTQFLDIECLSKQSLIKQRAHIAQKGTEGKGKEVEKYQDDNFISIASNENLDVAQRCIVKTSYLRHIR